MTSYLCLFCHKKLRHLNRMVFSVSLQGQFQKMASHWTTTICGIFTYNIVSTPRLQYLWNNPTKCRRFSRGTHTTWPLKKMGVVLTHEGLFISYGSRWYCWWKKSCTSWYGIISQHLQGFIHPRWLFGISSIHSIPPGKIPLLSSQDLYPIS